MNAQETVTIDWAELEAMDGEILRLRAILTALSNAVNHGNNDTIALTDLAIERLYKIDCISCRIRGEKEPEAPEM